MDEEENRPWEKLRQHVEEGNPTNLLRDIEALPAAELARAISHLDQDEQSQLLTMLTPEEAADVIEEVHESQAIELLEDLEPGQAAAIIDELRSDHQADILGELDADDAEAILDKMDPEEAADVLQLLSYPSDVAGGLMITEYLSYPTDLSVDDVFEDLRRNRAQYAEYDVQYAYVTQGDNILVGVLPMRDLMLAAGTTTLAKLMRRNPYSVDALSLLSELRDFFDEHAFLGLPVVSTGGRLVGVVQRSEVEHATGEQANRAFLESSGIVGGEELRSMSLWRRSSRRLSWLSVNILLNIIAASVIAFYQDTLAAVIALAVFLPIISDMSGCSGNQAVAVSIRELTLGLLKPNELFRVLFKEAGVGLLNGSVLGALIGIVAWIWQGNPYLGLVVGGALAANTLLAVLIGGLVPLVLRRFGMDPALASGPILTTVTDMCGFFLVLSLASSFLSYLT